MIGYFFLKRFLVSSFCDKERKKERKKERNMTNLENEGGRTFDILMTIVYCIAFAGWLVVLLYGVSTLFGSFHAQIFGDNFPSTEHFHVQLTCIQSKHQLAMATYYL